MDILVSWEFNKRKLFNSLGQKLLLYDIVTSANDLNDRGMLVSILLLIIVTFSNLIYSGLMFSIESKLSSPLKRPTIFNSFKQVGNLKFDSLPASRDLISIQCNVKTSSFFKGFRTRNK
jgi:hypothetical protein